MSSPISRSLSRGAERGEGGRGRREGGRGEGGMDGEGESEGGREGGRMKFGHTETNCKICLLATFFTKSFNLPHIWNGKKENVTTHHPQAHTHLPCRSHDGSIVYEVYVVKQTLQRYVGHAQQSVLLEIIEWIRANGLVLRWNRM